MKDDDPQRVEIALRKYPPEERAAWFSELKRLAEIVEAYLEIKPKRLRAKPAGRFEFAPEVLMLCKQAGSTDPVIIRREPHRRNPPSPHTLDRWSRAYRKEGMSVFVREESDAEMRESDRRLARMTREAVEWVQEHWRGYHSPHRLYLDWRKEAERRQWKIPGESWLYRRWREMPGIVKIVRDAGWGAYESRYAPYVPRDYADLAALQALCGDHSERDVFVNDHGRARRPWLTVWQDLRTGLIWGWYLDRKPSSETAGLAYADGILNFGAQPPPRPEENFHSYIYTDQGKDYRSHDWNGKVIAVHQHAMTPSGGLELILTQRQVGIPEELQIRHLFARGYNAKEKPVERFFRTLSEWEKNTFDEYCGSGPGSKPERLKQMFSQQRAYEQGCRDSSPLISWENYQAKLAQFISDFNQTPHERTNLEGGATVTPQAEYLRLYRTRYDISPETVSLLLMKTGNRLLQKNGVNCFKRGWYYWCDEMSQYKDATDPVKVEVRYTDRDYSRVWVVLPDKKAYEAPLIKGSSLLNPNKETLQTVAKARAHERKVIRDFELLAQSMWREETTEDRVSRLMAEQSATETEPVEVEQSRVYYLTRLEQTRTDGAPQPAPAIEIESVAGANGEVIIRTAHRILISEVDDDR
ncbi:MAG: Mu transposase C-terminal domain-containing protein [Burkholderiales bacterium]